METSTKLSSTDPRLEPGDSHGAPSLFSLSLLLLLVGACGDDTKRALLDAGVDAALPELDAALPEEEHDAGVGDAGPPTDAADDAAVKPVCAAAGVGLIRGRYMDASGVEHWFSASPTAQLYTTVPAGVARSDAPPTLVEVREVCASSTRGHFVASDRDAKNMRVDWLVQDRGLSVCAGQGGSDAIDALMSAAGPDANHLDGGCYGAAWVRVWKRGGNL